MAGPSRPDVPDHAAMAADITIVNAHDYIPMSELVAKHPTATVMDWGTVFRSVSHLFAPDDGPPARRQSAADKALQRWGFERQRREAAAGDLDDDEPF